MLQPLWHYIKVVIRFFKQKCTLQKNLELTVVDFQTQHLSCRAWIYSWTLFSSQKGSACISALLLHLYVFHFHIFHSRSALGVSGAEPAKRWSQPSQHDCISSWTFFFLIFIYIFFGDYREPDISVQIRIQVNRAPLTPHLMLRIDAALFLISCSMCDRSARPSRDDGGSSSSNNRLLGSVKHEATHKTSVEKPHNTTQQDVDKYENMSQFEDKWVHLFYIYVTFEIIRIAIKRKEPLSPPETKERLYLQNFLL